MTAEHAAAEERKDLVRRFLEEVVGEGNWEVANEIIDHEYVPFVEQLREAIPDLQVNIVDGLEAIEGIESDVVLARWAATGHQTGPVVVEEDGETTTIATGLLVEFRVTIACQISDGRIQEAWMAGLSYTANGTAVTGDWEAWSIEPSEWMDEEDRNRGHPICRCTPLC